MNAGIEVVTGVEEEALREQNRVFLKYIATGLPWVALKTAMTLDGKIAAFTGDARWVTGDDARLRVHRMRSEYMGIMVGSGTVKTDDPLLNCRLEGEHRQPVRIVVDSKASVAFDSQVVRTARVFPLLVAHTVQADEEQLEMIQEAGGGTLLCEEKDGRVDITDLLKKLGARGIDSVLLEGGGELNYTFVKAGVIDEVYAFIAPKIVGGKTAKTPVEGEGFKRMGEALELSPFAVEAIGRDILLMARPIVKH